MTKMFKLVGISLLLAVGLFFTGAAQATQPLKIIMVPKFTGAAYFQATQLGAEQAVAEFKSRGIDIDFQFVGSVEANTDEEIRIIDDAIAQKPDALLFSANDNQALIPVLKKAKDLGIKVIGFDADVSDPSARDFFVNQAPFSAIGATLIDVVAEEAGCNVQAAVDPNCTVKYAIISADPGAFNQNSWIAAMNEEQAKRFPNMELLKIEFGFDRPDESFTAAQNLINAFGSDLQAIIAPTSVAFPRAAEAVEQANLVGKVIVTGLSTPNDMKDFVKRGIVKTVVLWNPVDLGYLPVYGAVAELKGAPFLLEVNGRTFISGGALGLREILPTFDDITATSAEGPSMQSTLNGVVLLGDPFRFNQDNIDNFDF